jgi:hypothetical protein
VNLGSPPKKRTGKGALSVVPSKAQVTQDELEALLAGPAGAVTIKRVNAGQEAEPPLAGRAADPLPAGMRLLEAAEVEALALHELELVGTEYARLAALDPNDPLLLEAAVASKIPNAPNLPGSGYDPKQPRWPKGTERGGEWVRVGQRFSIGGEVWEIAHVINGRVYAHKETSDPKKAATAEFDPTKMGGAKAPTQAGHDAEANVLAGITDAPALSVKGGKKGSTVTVVDPYVDSSTHDPSIPIPKDSPITPEEWKRFGKIDQENYARVQEKFGTWGPGKAQKHLQAAYSKYEDSVVQLVKSAYSSQYGSSNGFTLSLTSIFSQITGTGDAVKKVVRQREKAKELQGDHKDAVQWDLYNRARAPDLATFHKSGAGPAWWNQNIIDKNPAFSGLSQSFHFRAHFFGDTAVASPIAIRHFLMSTYSGHAVPTSFDSELEVSVADQLKLTSDKTIVFSSNGLSPGQRKWLESVTSQPQGGQIIEQFKGALGGKVDLPIPPQPPTLTGFGSSNKQWKDPPGDVGTNIPTMHEGDPLPAGTKVGDLQMLTGEALPANKLRLKEGDYIQGMQGTRYVILADPGDSTGFGYRYYELDPTTGQHNGKSYNFEGGGVKTFYKLDGHYEFPQPKAEKKTGFNANAWVNSSETKFTNKLAAGDKFKVHGHPYEVTGPPSTAGVPIKSLESGQTGFINVDYKTPWLVPTEGYDPDNDPELQQFAGKLKAQVGDVLPIDGKKATVTKILKDGTVQVNTHPGVVKLAPDDPKLEGLYRSDDWVPGEGKQKLKTMAPGQKFHAGTGAKVRPYEVVDPGPKTTKVRNLETGEESEMSSQKSFLPLVQPAPPGESAPGPEDVSPVTPVIGGVHDPALWTPTGTYKDSSQLEVGDKFTAADTQFEVIADNGTELKLWNLDAGEEHPVAIKKDGGASWKTITHVSAPTPLADVEKADTGVIQATSANIDPAAFAYDADAFEEVGTKPVASLGPGNVFEYHGKTYYVAGGTPPDDAPAQFANNANYMWVYNVDTGEGIAVGKSTVSEIAKTQQVPIFERKEGVGPKVGDEVAHPDTAEKLAALTALEGEKIRVTWPNGTSKTGEVTVNKQGHVIVGGAMAGGEYQNAVTIEKKVGSKYKPVHDWGVNPAYTGAVSDKFTKPDESGAAAPDSSAKPLSEYNPVEGMVVQVPDGSYVKLTSGPYATGGWFAEDTNTGESTFVAGSLPVKVLPVNLDKPQVGDKVKWQGNDQLAWGPGEHSGTVTGIGADGTIFYSHDGGQSGSMSPEFANAVSLKKVGDDEVPIVEATTHTYDPNAWEATGDSQKISGMSPGTKFVMNGGTYEYVGTKKLTSDKTGKPYHAYTLHNLATGEVKDTPQFALAGKYFDTVEQGAAPETPAAPESGLVQGEVPASSVELNAHVILPPGSGIPGGQTWRRVVTPSVTPDNAPPDAVWFQNVSSGQVQWVGAGYPAVLTAAPSEKKSGRSPTGKLRNFGSMGDKKFEDTLAAVVNENNDPDAIAAVKAEAAKRGIEILSAPEPPPPRSSRPEHALMAAAAAPAGPTPPLPEGELTHPTLKPKEFDADGAYVGEGGFDPGAWVATGYAQLSDLAPGTVFSTQTGLAYKKVDESKIMALHSGHVAGASPMLEVSVLSPKAGVDVPYDQFTPGDEVKLGKLKAGDQFTVGGALYEVVEPPADLESDATVAPVLPGGGLGHPTSEGAIPDKPVSFHAKGSGPQLSDLPLPESAIADFSTLPKAEEHPDTPYAGYASKWGSGGKYQHFQIQEMAAGTVFRDKNGETWKVKQPGANAIITDGSANYAVNGSLRGRVLEDTKAVHFSDTSPPLGNPDDFVQAAVAAALSPNVASTPVQSMVPGDFFESENGKTWLLDSISPDLDGKYVVMAHETDTNTPKLWPGVYMPPKVGFKEQADNSSPLSPKPEGTAVSTLEPGEMFHISPTSNHPLPVGTYKSMGPAPGTPSKTTVQNIASGQQFIIDNHVGVLTLDSEQDLEQLGGEEPPLPIHGLAPGDGFYAHPEDAYGHLAPGTEYYVYETSPGGVTIMDTETDEMSLIPPDTLVAPSGGDFSDTLADELLLGEPDIWGGLDPTPLDKLTYVQKLKEFQSLTEKSGTPNGLAHGEGARYDELKSHLENEMGGGGTGYSAAPGDEVTFNWHGADATGTLVDWDEAGNALIDIEGLLYAHPKSAYLGQPGVPPPDVPETPAPPPPELDTNPFGPDAAGEPVPEHPVGIGETITTAGQLAKGMHVKSVAGQQYEVVNIEDKGDSIEATVRVVGGMSDGHVMTAPYGKSVQLGWERVEAPEDTTPPAKLEFDPTAWSSTGDSSPLASLVVGDVFYGGGQYWRKDGEAELTNMADGEKVAGPLQIASVFDSANPHVYKLVKAGDAPATSPGDPASYEQGPTLPLHELGVGDSFQFGGDVMTVTKKHGSHVTGYRYADDEFGFNEDFTLAPGHTMQDYEVTKLIPTGALVPPLPDEEPIETGPALSPADVLSPYKSAWGSGGKYKHEPIGTLSPGTSFVDKGGSAYTVKAHLTDGTTTYEHAGGKQYVTSSKNRVKEGGNGMGSTTAKVAAAHTPVEKALEQLEQKYGPLNQLPTTGGPQGYASKWGSGGKYKHEEVSSLSHGDEFYGAGSKTVWRFVASISPFQFIVVDENGAAHVVEGSLRVRRKNS